MQINTNRLTRINTAQLKWVSNYTNTLEEDDLRDDVLLLTLTNRMGSNAVVLHADYYGRETYTYTIDIDGVTLKQYEGETDESL